MSFGKKSSNNNTAPQPTFTQQPTQAQQPIQRTANTAEAQDRASTNNGAASLLATDEEEMRRRQTGAGTLSTY